MTAAGRTPLALLTFLAVIAFAIATALTFVGAASGCVTRTLVIHDHDPDTAAVVDNTGTGTSAGAVDNDDDAGPFYEPLAPYGDWFWSPRWGWVYTPRVQPGWRPYTIGHWVLTDDGWLWASSEPFGWACFHYGRWVWLDDAGWVWIPGRAWAPAWVSWRAGGGYYGWAPMPPPGVVVVAPFFWVFVVEHDFLADDVDRVAIVPARNPAVLPSSRVIHRPEQREVERVTMKPVPIRKVVESNGAARALGGDDAVVVVPRLRTNAAAPGDDRGGDRADRDQRARPTLPARIDRSDVIPNRTLTDVPGDDDIDRVYDMQRRRLTDDKDVRQLEDDKAREKSALQKKRTVPRKIAKPKAAPPAPTPVPTPSKSKRAPE